MRNLIPPYREWIDVYDEVIKRKEDAISQTRLQGLREVLKSRYQVYEANTSELSVIQMLDAWNDDDKTCLQNCYSRRGYIGYVIEQIKSLQPLPIQTICPYCGISNPNSVDHYLPKEKFPEFSILGLNLLPCCSECNSKKGRRWLNEGGRRSFINYYFDDLEDKKFFYTRVSFDGPNPDLPIIKFQLVQPENMSRAQFDIAQSHFRLLKLCDLYYKKASDELNTVLENITISRDLSVAVQKCILQNRLEIEKNKYGVNFWRVSLYEGILENDALFTKRY